MVVERTEMALKVSIKAVVTEVNKSINSLASNVIKKGTWPETVQMRIPGLKEVVAEDLKEEVEVVLTILKALHALNAAKKVIWQEIVRTKTLKTQEVAVLQLASSVVKMDI